MPLAQAGEGCLQLQWWQPEEGGRRGHKVEVVELIWRGCNGFGSDRGWAVVGRVKGRRRKVNRGLGDIVLGGCGSEWTKYLRSRAGFTERGLRAKSEERRVPEHKGFLTTCCCAGTSYRGPIECYNREFCFLAIRTYYLVCIAVTQC